jgi:multiple sugar transport system ATP-binding protein
MRTEITKLHQRLDATIIYVTRDPVEAMMMGERIVVMNKGVVQQNDPSLTLYDNPANLFVAGFVGSPPMNFIDGTLKQDRDSLLFNENEDGTLRARFVVSERAGVRDFIGKPIVLGIRPEDIEIAQSSSENTDATTSFAAIIDAAEPVGAETYLHLQTGAHTVICRTQRALDHREAGRRMRFDVNLAKAHLFDPVSTNRVI